MREIAAQRAEIEELRQKTAAQKAEIAQKDARIAELESAAEADAP